MTEELEKLLKIAEARELNLADLLYNGSTAGRLFGQAHALACALSAAVHHSRALDKMKTDEAELYEKFGQARPLGKTYKVEVKETGGFFYHRLVCSDGRVSHWSTYQYAAFLDDKVSITGYFAVPPHELTPIDMATALDYMCSPEDKGNNVTPEYFAAIKFPYSEEHDYRPTVPAVEPYEAQVLPGFAAHPEIRVLDPDTVSGRLVLTSDQLSHLAADTEYTPETPAEEGYREWVPGAAEAEAAKEDEEDKQGD